MHITHLAFRNFKGRNFESDLKPVTLIHGSNFAAKTSIPLAIRLALRGSLPPPIGVKGVYALAGNPDDPGSMEIHLQLGDRKVDWKWTKDAKGKLSAEGGVPADLMLPEMLMEPRLFFQKTAAERTRAIFDACDPKDLDFDIDGLLDQFRTINHPPMKFCDGAKKLVTRKIEALKEADLRPQEFCSQLIDWLKVEAKSKADNAKFTSGSFGAFRVNAPDGKVEDVSKELEAKRQELAKLQVVDVAAINKRLEQLQGLKFPADLAQQLSGLLNEIEVPSEEDPNDLVKLLSEQIAQLRSESVAADLHARSLTKDIEAMTNAKCCPFCGTAGIGWKNKKLEEYKEKHTQKTELVIKNSVRISHLEQQLRQAQSEIERSLKLKELTETIQKQNETKNEIEEITQQLAAVSDRTEQIEALQAEISALNDKQAKFISFQADKERMASMEETLLKSECESLTLKSILKLVTEQQASLVGSAFKKVLATARHFTDGLLNSPLEFVNGELGRRVSEADKKIGCKASAGSWISHEVFSGTEELLAYCGFAVSLANTAPIKIVFLDELGRLDPKRKLAVAERMLALEEQQIIDQSILIDVSTEAYSSIKFAEFGLIKL